MSHLSCIIKHIKNGGNTDSTDYFKFISDSDKEMLHRKNSPTGVEGSTGV